MYHTKWIVNQRFIIRLKACDYECVLSNSLRNTSLYVLTTFPQFVSLFPRSDGFTTSILGQPDKSRLIVLATFVEWPQQRLCVCVNSLVTAGPYLLAHHAEPSMFTSPSRTPTTPDTSLSPSLSTETLCPERKRSMCHCTLCMSPSRPQFSHRNMVWIETATAVVKITNNCVLFQDR